MLSILIAVYNEQECLADVITELFTVLAGMDMASEVVAINDGSTDGSLDILNGLKGQYPTLRVLSLNPHSGQSAAFGVGFRRAKGDVLITIDADGQNDPADIPTLMGHMQACDACCGYRADRQDTFSRRLGGKLANGVRNALLGEDIIDTGCSLKAFKADFVRDVTMWDGMHRFLLSFVKMKGGVIKQIPVNHRRRQAGTSKYTNLGRLKTIVSDLRAVRWMQSRHRPFDVEES
ncbi:MAG: glycosyltransferase family 2 protein [Verrucomicrobia bacterium]|jgi:dolichol-phosphate mannosyltransferase|nr:glycosyltransferase family 2 protein [Verrucomicrobiota bacterium]MBT7068325.1 glycosyltransferase family 2 protein [Verrucomicrobiota bacterium]MBT7699934.1 glycosyltransferase family 2 protein [Verrucomicrobiota bacterium]